MADSLHPIPTPAAVWSRLTLAGMEYDGLYFLGREYFATYDGTPHNYLSALAAHETAH